MRLNTNPNWIRLHPIQTRVQYRSKHQQWRRGSPQHQSRKTEIRLSKMEVIDEAKFRCLDHIDSLGLSLVNSRSRYLVNWFIHGLKKLQHPNADSSSIVESLRGQKSSLIKDLDWPLMCLIGKDNKIEPILVQKLADRKSTFLSYGFLHHIWFPEKYEEEEARVLEKRRCEKQS